MNKRVRKAAGESVTLKQAMILAGLEPRLAGILAAMPHRMVDVDPRRPFR